MPGAAAPLSVLQVDEFSQTALHYAAAFGHLPCVTALSRFGADVYASEAGGRTAAELASAASHAQVASYLRRIMEAGGSDSTNDGRAFSVADASGLGSIGGGTPAGRTAQAALQQQALAAQQQQYQQQTMAAQTQRQLAGMRLGVPGAAGGGGVMGQAFGGAIMAMPPPAPGPAPLGGPGATTGFDYSLGQGAVAQQQPAAAANPYYGGDAAINGGGIGGSGGGAGGGGGFAGGYDASGGAAGALQTPGRFSVGPGAGAGAPQSALPPPPPQQPQQLPQMQQQPQLQPQPGAAALAAAQQQLALASAYGFGGVAPPPLPPGLYPSLFGGTGMAGAGATGSALGFPPQFHLAGGMGAGGLGFGGVGAGAGGGLSHQQALAQLAQLQLQNQLQALTLASGGGGAGGVGGGAGGAPQQPSPMQQLLALQQQQQAIIALSATQQQALPPLPAIPPARARLRDWLLSIGMSEYYPAFLRQGYDDIDFLFAAGGLSDADCSALQIQLSGHRRKVRLAPPLRRDATAPHRSC